MPVHDDPELGPLRRCSVCGEDWPLDEEFWMPQRHPRSVNDRWMSRCRGCRREATYAWRRQPVVAERLRKRAAERLAERMQGPESDAIRARHRAAQRRYYHRHRQEVNERLRERYASEVGRPLYANRGRPRLLP